MGLAANPFDHGLDAGVREDRLAMRIEAEYRRAYRPRAIGVDLTICQRTERVAFVDSQRKRLHGVRREC